MPSPEGPRRYRAGQPIEDLCRACKAVRDHTVIAVDDAGRVLRVACGFCGSQHNYRGGGGDAAAPIRPPEPVFDRENRERTQVPMSGELDGSDLEKILRRVIREEAGLTPVAPADKWRGGQLVLRPGKPGLQEKAWPIEAFFHKVVMLRNRLRTLEQQVNASDLPEDQKLKLQSYVTGCYGSLTSFNILFAAEEDQFRGAAAKDDV
jgi:hypothetical protein